MSMCSFLLWFWKRVFAMTRTFSWQNSVSLCPASFCTPRPNLPVAPGISFDFLLLHFAISLICHKCINEPHIPCKKQMTHPQLTLKKAYCETCCDKDFKGYRNPKMKSGTGERIQDSRGGDVLTLNHNHSSLIERSWQHAFA